MSISKAPAYVVDTENNKRINEKKRNIYMIEKKNLKNFEKGKKGKVERTE